MTVGLSPSVARYKKEGPSKDDLRELFAKDYRSGGGGKRPQRTPQDVGGANGAAAAEPMERWHPLSASSYIGAVEEGREGGAKRPRGEPGLHEKLLGMPEAKLYMQLVELESKIDAVTSRKRLEFTEELKAPRMSTRVLQVYVYNTHEHQAGGGAPSWTLHLAGRLLDDSGGISGGGAGSKEPPFTEFFDRVFIHLPPEAYPDRHTVQWCRGKKGQGGEGDAVQSFKLRREGSSECIVRIQLQPTYTPMRYSLKGQPELAKLLKWQRGTWSSLLLAFWAYVRDEGLQDDDSTLYVRLDDAMRAIFDDKEGRMPLTMVGERLWEFVSEVDPVQLEYTLCLSGEAKPAVFEVLVEAEDTVVGRMRDLMDEEGIRASKATCDAIDTDISGLMVEIEACRRKRDFMKGFADSPVRFLHEVVYAMSLDLATIRATGPSQFSQFGPEEVLRAQLWQQPWTEEAVLHYLDMQGHAVNLNVENTLAEEVRTTYPVHAQGPSHLRPHLPVLPPRPSPASPPSSLSSGNPPLSLFASSPTSSLCRPAPGHSTNTAPPLPLPVPTPAGLHAIITPPRYPHHLPLLRTPLRLSRPPSPPLPLPRPWRLVK